MINTEFDSFIHLLSNRAAQEVRKVAYVFDNKQVTYGQLWDSINGFAAFLVRQGLKRGDRIVLALPNGDEFFTAFYGTQRAGGIAVPVFPILGSARIEVIAGLCNAKAIVIPSEPEHPGFKSTLSQVLDSKRAVLTVRKSYGQTGQEDFPEIQPDDLAMIQYTSGSTGHPKGVMLSHSNLLVNTRQMASGMQHTENDIFVSWLPLSHDLGLVVMSMIPLFLGAKLILLPTSITNSRRWMETIEKHRATFTAAPDFAYRMCNSFLKHPEEYDLSSLRIAMNAAEPVRAQTAHKFEENFGLKNIMMPAYGLAEVTCGVSMWPAGTPLKIDERKFVSFGAGFPGITIKILSNGRLVGPHVIGEIIVDSPANSRGYFNNEADTSLLFWNKKFIRTGDLGYCDEDGDFFIVGREKNIIIQQGRNISPHEIEEVIDSLRFVRYSAAVGIDQGHLQGEQAYVFAEVRTRKNTHIDKLQAMTKSMVKAIHSELGFRPGRIYLVRPHAIARTHNGKIKHAALKQDYSEGRLRKEGLILFPDY